MSCEECLPLLEEHADGELGARDAARVEAHLETCALCARARQRLEDERAVFLAHECDAAPAAGFWDEVLSKIEAETPARPYTKHADAAAARPSSTSVRARLAAALGVFAAPRLSPATVAALLFVAVAATVFVMKYTTTTTTREEAATSETVVKTVAPERDVETASPSSSKPKEVERAAVERPLGVGGKAQRVRVKGVEESRRASVASHGEAAPERLVREAEEKYLAAIRLLSRDVSGRRSRLDADTRARFAQTLAAVDRTIADTRRAAREHPRDPVAVQYMLTAYAKKVEVLREMARH